MDDFKKKCIWFVSSPVRPINNIETEVSNVLNTYRYIRALESCGIYVTAPYLGNILAEHASKYGRQEDDVEWGMETDKQILCRCFGLILVGDRISEGMQGELDLALSLKMPVMIMCHMTPEEVEAAVVPEIYNW